MGKTGTLGPLADRRDGAEWWLTADALVRWNVLQDHHPVLVATEAAT